MHYQAVTTAILVALAATAGLAAEPYRVEKTHADLLFDIDHAGFTRKHGSFRNLDAALQYDAQHPEQSHVSVTVQVDSIDTGFALRDQELKGEKFRDVAKCHRYLEAQRFRRRELCADHRRRGANRDRRGVQPEGHVGSGLMKEKQS